MHRQNGNQKPRGFDLQKQPNATRGPRRRTACRRRAPRRTPRPRTRTRTNISRPDQHEASRSSLIGRGLRAGAARGRRAVLHAEAGASAADDIAGLVPATDRFLASLINEAGEAAALRGDAAEGGRRPADGDVMAPAARASTRCSASPTGARSARVHNTTSGPSRAVRDHGVPCRNLILVAALPQVAGRRRRSGGPCPAGVPPRENENEKRPDRAQPPSVLMSLRSLPGCASMNAVASTTKPSTTHQNESLSDVARSPRRMQRCASAALLDWFSDSSAWSELTTAGMAASRQRSSSSDESTALRRSVARPQVWQMPEQSLSTI